MLLRNRAHHTGRKRKEHIVSPDQHRKAEPSEDQEHKIDRNAPAGTEKSLGAESVRDGRPSTDDNTIEAIDELGPGPVPPDRRKP